MAYFAWHKLPRRLPLTALGATGCTSVCCCPEYLDLGVYGLEECGGLTPGACPNGNPFVNCDACTPYEANPQPPNPWEDFCCLILKDVLWCVGPFYQGWSPGLGSCYTRSAGFFGFCQPWFGTINSDGSINWKNWYYDTGMNCSGLEYGSNNTTQGPLTTKLTLGTIPAGTTGAFLWRIPNENSYLNERQKDPAHSVLNDGSIRYYRTPSSPNAEPEHVYQSKVCLRLKIPPSVPSRTMVLSGYNRYRYTGYLTNDAQLSGFEIPKIVSDPGASGLSEMEGSLGRSFPLSDDVMNYPLWGGSTAPSVLDWNNCPSSCVAETLKNINGGRTGDYCIGDDCLEVQAHSTTGHYMSMVSGNVTGHYHSFSGFNPYVKFWEASNSYVGVDDNGTYSAYVNGTGLPPCSLYSLAWALYDRSWRVLLDSNVVGTTAHSSEQGIYDDYNSSFGNVRSKLNSLLGDDPRNLTGAYGESVVTYWFDQLNNAITGFYEDYFTNEPNPTMPSHYNSDSSPKTKFGAFTPPGVILWDKTSFLNATTNADRWKSLYIPGSGNILFDSGCTQTNNGWKAYNFVVDDASHDMAWGSTHAARLVQFRVCDRSNDQIVANTYNSMRVIPYWSESDSCAICATSASPFGMTADTDCVTGPNPEVWGDLSVNTDYYPY